MVPRHRSGLHPNDTLILADVYHLVYRIRIASGKHTSAFSIEKFNTVQNLQLGVEEVILVQVNSCNFVFLKPHFLQSLVVPTAKF
jgi:hypothetical protein